LCVCGWVFFPVGFLGVKKILLPWWGHRVGPGNEWGGACGGQGKKRKGNVSSRLRLRERDGRSGGMSPAAAMQCPGARRGGGGGTGPPPVGVFGSSPPTPTPRPRGGGGGGGESRPATRRRLSHPASLPYVRCGRLPLWLGFSSSHTRFHTDSFFHLTGVGWPSRGRSLYIDFFK
jgi:hypothetical protein